MKQHYTCRLACMHRKSRALFHPVLAHLSRVLTQHNDVNTVAISGSFAMMFSATARQYLPLLNECLQCAEFSL